MKKKQTLIESLRNCTHKHKVTFQNGEDTMVYCSKANSFFKSLNGVIGATEANKFTVEFRGNFYGAGPFMVGSDAIFVDNYPPSKECGEIVEIEYIGNILDIIEM